MEILSHGILGTITGKTGPVVSYERFGQNITRSPGNGYKLFLDNVLYVFLVLSLIFPIYYSEFILGFIFGMTYTFGAILPTNFILIIAALGFLIYIFIRLLILRVTKTFAK